MGNQGESGDSHLLGDGVKCIGQRERADGSRLTASGRAATASPTADPRLQIGGRGLFDFRICGF